MKNKSLIKTKWFSIHVSAMTLAGILTLSWTFLMGCIFAGLIIILNTRDSVDQIIAIIATPILMLGTSSYYWKWAARFDHYFERESKEG